MEITTNSNFTHQVDTLFKTLVRLRYKDIVSKEKLLQIKEYIHQLYYEQNKTQIKNILLKTYKIAYQLEKQSTDKINNIESNTLRRIKRKKQLSKNLGGNSP